MRRLVCQVFAVLLALGSQGFASAQERPKPLKIYILAGQSNMEGHAKISTFDYIADDPKTAPILKEMLGPDGKPKVCDNVWVSYFTGDAFNKENGEGLGKLTAGFGARQKFSKPGDEIGPEFTFGIYMNRGGQGTDPDHQDGLGRQIGSHRLSTAERGTLSTHRGGLEAQGL